jgi:hypothetical protein
MAVIEVVAAIQLVRFFQGGDQLRQVRVAGYSMNPFLKT